MQTAAVILFILHSILPTPDPSTAGPSPHIAGNAPGTTGTLTLEQQVGVQAWNAVSSPLDGACQRDTVLVAVSRAGSLLYGTESCASMQMGRDAVRAASGGTTSPVTDVVSSSFTWSCDVGQWVGRAFLFELPKTFEPTPGVTVNVTPRVVWAEDGSPQDWVVGSTAAATSTRSGTSAQIEVYVLSARHYPTGDSKHDNQEELPFLVLALEITSSSGALAVEDREATLALNPAM